MASTWRTKLSWSSPSSHGGRRLAPWMAAKRSSAASGHGRAGGLAPPRQVLLDVGVVVEPGVEGHLDAVDPQDAPVVLAVAVDRERDPLGVAPVGHLPGQGEGADGNPEGGLPVGGAGGEAAEPVGVGRRPLHSPVRWRRPAAG